jgi:hypothetical protein
VSKEGSERRFEHILWLGSVCSAPLGLSCSAAPQSISSYDLSLCRAKENDFLDALEPFDRAAELAGLHRQVEDLQAQLSALRSGSDIVHSADGALSKAATRISGMYGHCAPCCTREYVHVDYADSTRPGTMGIRF